MKALTVYSVQFSGLAPGKHEYEYEIDKKFFDAIEYSELKEGNVHLALELEKHNTMLVLNFSLRGTITVNCDRCGDAFSLPVKDKQRLIVKFGEQAGEETEEIIVIPRNESEINVAHYIYEYICLALPQKRIHPEGKCNKEALKQLEKLEEENNKNKTTDPRWEGLKNIILN